MRSHYFPIFALLLATSAWSQGSLASKTKASPDWKTVDDAMGRAGQDQPDGTHKYSMPRRDLKVTAGGVDVKAGLALGSWTAFEHTATGAMVMGDLVLTEDEVAPVMGALTGGGIEITALHNHLLHESPRVMYMHIHGQGDAIALAKTIHDALQKTQTPAVAAAQTQPDLGIDTKQIDQILGYTGRNNGGIYQFAVPRADAVREGGMKIPNSMGVATAINFQPTSGGKAICSRNSQGFSSCTSGRMMTPQSWPGDCAQPWIRPTLPNRNELLRDR